MINNLVDTEETLKPIKNTHLRLTHLARGVPFPPHWHLEMEIMLPYEDQSKVVCGGRLVTLEKNDFLFVAPGVLHSICPSNGARDYVLADCSILSEINIVAMALSLMNPFFHVSPTINPDLYIKIAERIKEMRQLSRQSPAANEAFIYSKMLEIFNLMAISNHSSPESVNDSRQPWEKSHESMLYACSYINTNFHQKLQLEDVANQVGFSKYHFSRLFHAFTGQTFYGYLTQKRISYATQLLAVQDMSIGDIAYQSGFSSPTAFSRAFKNITKSTPSEYRQSYQ